MMLDMNAFFSLVLIFLAAVATLGADLEIGSTELANRNLYQEVNTKISVEGQAVHLNFEPPGAADNFKIIGIRILDKNRGGKPTISDGGIGSSHVHITLTGGIFQNVHFSIEVSTLSIIYVLFLTAINLKR